MNSIANPRPAAHGAGTNPTAKPRRLLVNNAEILDLLDARERARVGALAGHIPHPEALAEIAAINQQLTDANALVIYEMDERGRWFEVVTGEERQ